MVSLSSWDVSSAQQRSENERATRRRAPRGLTAERVYAPDLERQVEALLYLLRAAVLVPLPREGSTSAESAPAAGGEAA